MLFLLGIISLAQSELTIISPDDLKNTERNTSVSVYGNPSLLPRVGVLQLQELDVTCDFYEVFNEFSFLVIPPTPKCEQDLIIQNAVLKNASMIIFLVEDNQLTPVHSSVSSLESTNFTVIHVSKSLEKSIKSMHKYPIWAKYEYHISVLDQITITYYFTHNYTIDKLFIEKILSLNRNLLDFSPKFSYINITNTTEQKDNCYMYKKKAYCLKPGNNGSEIIENGFYISKLSQELGDSWVFLETMLGIYNDCEFDYSLGCLEKNAKVNKEIEPDFNNWVEQNSILPFYKFNQKSFYWPKFLKEAYCIGRKESPEFCGKCAESCHYNSLNKGMKFCYYCNFSSCGYVNLECLQEESIYGEYCYKFMLNDGSCNKGCVNDPDCANDKDLDISDKIGIYVIAPSVLIFFLMWIFFSCYIKRRNQPPVQNPEVFGCERRGSRTDEHSPVDPPKNLQYYKDIGEFAGQDTICYECQRNISLEENVKKVNDADFSHLVCPN